MASVINSIDSKTSVVEQKCTTSFCKKIKREKNKKKKRHIQEQQKQIINRLENIEKHIKQREG